MHGVTVVGMSTSSLVLNSHDTLRGTERQLKNSGVVLSGLRARKEEKALFGDPVWMFAMSAGAELPFHRFAAGDAVILSAKLRCGLRLALTSVSMYAPSFMFCVSTVSIACLLCAGRTACRKRSQTAT